MQPFEYKDSIVMLSDIEKDNLFISKLLKTTAELKEGQYKQTKLNELQFLKESNKDLYNHLKFNLN